MNIHTRVALVCTGLAVFCALAFVGQWWWSNERYHQEVTQKLHADLAHYIVDHLAEPLFRSGPEGQVEVNHKVLKSIAMNTMMINPSVEVYLLDKEGRVLGHALPEKEVEAEQVDVHPIEQFVAGRPAGAIKGENPRDRSIRTIFSATPVMHQGQALGYLYVLLGSHQQQTVANALQGSHTLRVALVALALTSLFFAILAWLAFQKLTSPLRTLAKRVRNYRLAHLDADAEQAYRTRDEVEELEHSIDLMQQRIQQQFDKLLQNEQQRKELVSNVSHDLRTPLTAIQGYLETLLQMEQGSETRVQDYLQVAHRQSRYLGALIDELFELSRLDAGQVQPEYETFSMSELLYDLSADYRLRAESQQVKIEMDVPDSQLSVHADIALIQRVLRNLMDNALKHTPAGGRVRWVARSSSGQIEIDLHDSGAGIPEQDLPFVFERYFQSAASSSESRDGKQALEGKTPGEGSGLGLSIVRKILELHQSSIAVSSALGQGTQFRFALKAV